MTDIDFDELDKAVSSVMKPEPSAPPAVAAPVVSSSPAVLAPVAAVEPPATQPGVVLPRKNLVGDAAAASPRTGRFMDVVHPSSDMRVAPPSAASRTIASLVPSSPSVSLDAVASVSAVETTTDEASPPPLSSDELPLADASASKPVMAELPIAVATDAPAEPIDAAVPPSAESSEPVVASSALSTVENAPAADTPASEPVVPPAPTAPDVPPDAAESAANLGIPPSPPGPALPKELSSEIVAVEANEQDMPDPVEVADEAAPEGIVSSSTPAVPSIPQQYSSGEATADSETHPVFDTRAYHQPLKAEKKSHTWLWAVLVVALLGVGAAIGAIFFTIGL